MTGILFFKALKSKKDSCILILRPQTSISRCASLTGLACIVALAILTNVTSLFEYKTKVQVNFLRFIFLGTPQLFPPKKIKVWHNIYYRRTWLSKGRVLFGERFLFQQTKVQERPLGDISWSCPHTCAWTPFISRLENQHFTSIQTFSDSTFYKTSRFWNTFFNNHIKILWDLTLILSSVFVAPNFPKSDEFNIF